MALLASRAYPNYRSVSLKPRLYRGTGYGLEAGREHFPPSVSYLCYDEDYGFLEWDAMFLVDRYQRFRGTYCLHFDAEDQVPLKHGCPSTILHGVTSQKTVILTPITVRTSNLTSSFFMVS
jgi:hypothetical protein